MDFKSLTNTTNTTMGGIAGGLYGDIVSPK